MKHTTTSLQSLDHATDSRQFTLVKLSIQQLIDAECQLVLTPQEEAACLIAQQNSLLFDQVQRLRTRQRCASYLEITHSSTGRSI